MRSSPNCGERLAKPRGGFRQLTAPGGWIKKAFVMKLRLPRAVVVVCFLLVGTGVGFGEGPGNGQLLADRMVEAVRENPVHAEEIVRKAIREWEASGPHGDAAKSFAAIVGGAVSALPRSEAVAALQAAMAARPGYASGIARTALTVFPEGVRSRSENLVAYPGMRAGAAKVVKVQGGAAVCVDAEGRREPLREGGFLLDGCSISTGPATIVVLLFENGSTIQIEPDSEFSIDRLMTAPFDAATEDFRAIEKEPSRSSTQIGIVGGTLFFDVAKLDKSSSFEIVTPVGVAGIRGTAGFFQGSGSGPSSSFGLSSGAADFTTPNGRSSPVGAGESLAVGGKSQGYGMESNSASMAAMIQKSAEVAAQNRAAVGADAFQGAPRQEAGSQGTILSAEQLAALEQAAAEGVEALVQTALMLAMQAPAMASEIAAAAAALLPAAAVQVAVVIADAFPSMAPAVVAAVSAVVPALASTIATEVAQGHSSMAVAIALAAASVVPGQAAQILGAMAGAFPDQAPAIAAALTSLIPAQGDAISSALQISGLPGRAPSSQAPIAPPLPNQATQNPGVLNRENLPRSTPSPPRPTPPPFPTPTPTPVSPSA